MFNEMDIGKSASTRSFHLDRTFCRRYTSHRAMEHMCDIHQSPLVVLDDDKHCRDDVDVQRVMETLSPHMINSFGTDGLQLVQIATRRLAPPEVCKATSATVAQGTEQLIQFYRSV